MFVGIDITDDIELLTNSSGRSVIFYDNQKYLKSGESKSSYQYRCCLYMKKCKSRIIFNRDNQTACKNEVAHNHEVNLHAYNHALKSAVDVRRFGKFKF